MKLGNNLVPNLVSWEEMANHIVNLEQEVKIAIVGKYTGKTSNDAYLSVIKSLEHAANAVDRKLSILWVEADRLVDVDSTNQEKYDEAWAHVKEADGVVVPGGFGLRGMEGKIRCV
jgi:CTP synthase